MPMVEWSFRVRRLVLQSRVFRRHFLRLSRLSLLVSSWTRIPSTGATRLAMMSEAEHGRSIALFGI